MAALQAAAMSFPRAWSAAEIATVADAPGGIAICLADAMALGRVTLDEAELLTIAVAPDARRRGLGSDCLARFHDAARAKGADHVFLEVAQTNTAARALYARAGYAEVGRRKGYYAIPGGAAVDALILRRSLHP